MTASRRTVRRKDREIAKSATASVPVLAEPKSNIPVFASDFQKGELDTATVLFKNADVVKKPSNINYLKLSQTSFSIGHSIWAKSAETTAAAQDWPVSLPPAKIKKRL